ncbi:AraC family transcriptional regulator [Shewanella surugensis]|uniref:AraC family transcriptional regulator n=1 Tax=Shewanella surugensis TaxID=212020 RepID=A0ABT0LEE3_9GAMM|nr:AraC family transcriptional regulator [Shewanella surugensis]
MKLGDLSVSYMHTVIKAMHELGYNIDDILSNFLLSKASLSSPDARISIPKFMRLGHACINKASSPWFGLVMGTVTSPTHLGFAGLLANSSENIAQACHQLATYEVLSKYNVRGQSQFNSSLVANGKQKIHKNQQRGILQFYSIAPYNEYNYFVVDSIISGWYHIIMDLCGRNDAIEKVCFEFPAPSYEDKYREHFNCEVLFNQANNYLIVKGEALDWCCTNACRSTFTLLQRYADAELAKFELGQNFREKVCRALGPLLNGSTPTLEQVSEQLNMASWTVRRKLIEEGSSYQQTLNETRKDLALSYVCDTALTLGEIAYLLGFGSPTAFQRAFKRWAGVAPGQFRQANKARH